VRNPDASLESEALLAKMRHAAGSEFMSTCDAQSVASKFLGDTIGANILMLGFAWQLGLVPVSLAALMRAIELNNVAVPMNRLAFSIGRLAAGDPAGLEALWAERHASRNPSAAGSAAHQASGLDALIADREARLAAYGGARYVERYRALVMLAREADARAPSAGIAEAVATTFYRLLAVKDEYEVARLYRDAEFRGALEAQFEGTAGKDFKIRFNLAPPALAKGKEGGVPRKIAFGQWLWPVLGAIARCRGLRGTALDPFGRTLERRMERALANDYEQTMRRAFAIVSTSTAADIAKLASLYARVRGYGHVKLANLAAVKRGEREIASRLAIEAATSPAVQRALNEARGAGTLRGIPVVVAAK